MGEALNTTCPHCKYYIGENEDIVICPECNTSQHRSCWKQNNGCGTSGCKLSNSGDFDDNINIRYCPKCGVDNSKDSNYCRKCGQSFISKPTSYSYSDDYNSSYKRPSQSYSYQDEGLETGEKALICIGNICLSPLLGIILYFVWKDDKPKKSEDACTVTWVGFGLWILITFIFALGGR